MKRLILPTAALALALPLAAHAQVLQVATDQSPVGLDPHVATSFATILIDSNIFEGLTAIDADLRTVPALAQSWTVSPDGLSYSFTLRGNATFHNGKKVTPADVIASIERVRDPKTGSPYASRFAMIAKLEAAGENGVAITLNAPSAPLLTQLASLAIVPEGSGADLQRKPVGTGPFTFKEWIPDTAIVLEKNAHYWESGLPKLDGLRVNIVPEAATRQIGMLSGTYQVLPSIDAATATTLDGKPQAKLLATQDLAYSLIGFNTSKPPFDKKEVREAFNYAIDRAQLVQAAYFGRGAAGGPFSPALKQWALPTSDFACFKPDAAKSRALLLQAGITTPVKVTLNVLGSLQQVVDVAQVVQAQANKAGFEVTLAVQEQGKFIQDWRNSNFEAFASLNSGSPEPDDYLGRAFQTGGATNVYKYSNPALDDLLIKSRASTGGTAERKPLYDQAQRLITCDGPAAFLAYGTLFTAISPKVQGFDMMPTRSLWTLRAASLSR